MHFTLRAWHRVAVSIYFFCCGGIFATWASRIPSVIERFHFNEAELGAVLFMLPLGSLAALPVAGWAVSRLGSRTLTFAATLFYGVLLFWLGRCGQTWVLSSLLFFFGFWGNTLNISVNIQALHVQDELYKKSLMASFHGMWSLGALTGAFAGGVFMKLQWDMASHFGLVAVVLSLMAVLFYFQLIARDTPRGKEQRIFALPDKKLWVLGAICFCCAICEGAMADWSSLYYKEVVHDIHRISTTGYTAFAFCMAAGRLVGDRLADRLGYKGILVVDSLLISMGLGMALLLRLPITVMIGFGLVGLGVATIIPMVYALAGRSKSMAAGTALAAVSSVGFTGFLVGPPLIGFMAHAISLRWALLIVLALAMAIAPLSRLVKVE